ncbi:MAG: RNase adapter RapZ [Lachnospiraceae bacterium]|nr:RNase adapter RapZ [Lachnospiraceae bacterium]
MKFVIVTGMSGAGKSTTLKMLEDIGYFCVDNLPIPLIEKFAELSLSPGSEASKIAIGIDVRTGLKAAGETLDALREKGLEFDILFLEAENEVLVKRFKETRRAHPLSGEGRPIDGILKERELLETLKKNATYIIDTSHLLTRELKEKIGDIFSGNRLYANLYITVLSFGFKYGIPGDADLVFDVRFLPNPYYIEELKNKTGNDPEVQNFVMGFPEAEEFLSRLEDMLLFLIPNYIKEGKNQLIVAVGCTGGRHRSVTLANRLYERLVRHGQYGFRIEHRDMDKDPIRSGNT